MSIPMILASKSQPRRDVLYAAGICPTIRVSHVDEPAALEKAAAERGVTLHIPPISLCGDNGAMVAAQGYYEFLAGARATSHLNARATDE